uniref:Uncharacterized protein n=1 Tax=Macrostomum lignano TaxID=282301 RepID=A0A1I8JN80_9PLAT
MQRRPRRRRLAKAQTKMPSHDTILSTALPRTVFSLLPTARQRRRRATPAVRLLPVLPRSTRTAGCRLGAAVPAVPCEPLPDVNCTGDRGPLPRTVI